MDHYILSLDVGTQSIRAVIIDAEGNICDIAKTPIVPYITERPGWAEQAPEYWWQQLCATTTKLLSNPFLDKSKIIGVALTTQRGTIINLDKDGVPLRPAMVWLDQRMANKRTDFPRGVIKQGMKVMNLYDSVVHAMRQGEVNWLMQNQPEIWQKTYKYLFLSGFLNYRLTGLFKDSIGNTVGYMPFDYKKHRWSKESERNYKMFPVERNKLPDLVKNGEVLGKISAEASKQSLIPEGLPLIATASDKACEALGLGCMTPNIASLSFGTTATVQTTIDHYVEVIPFFPAYPSAIPGMFNNEIMIYRGFWMISWFKDEFGHKEVEQAKELKVEPEDLFDAMITDIPPGSMGLILQPYWSPGVRIPGTEAKGAIIGFGDIHNKAHIYRAIIEGLCYALKDGALRTERRTGVKIEKIRVAGGGSQSKNAMQITADIFNLPVEKAHTYETSALGAAIVAAVGLKLHKNYTTAIKQMWRIGDSFEPIPANRDIYDKLFNSVYLKMYKKLKPLYDEIRKITNYPEKT